jgi:hypothetical protein
MLGNRPGAGLYIDAEPHGMGRHHNVAVKHGSIDAVSTHRLQGDLG